LQHPFSKRDPVKSRLSEDVFKKCVKQENCRTGLLWNLFMSCPEVKKGLKNLGFQSPDL